MSTSAFRAFVERGGARRDDRRRDVARRAGRRRLRSTRRRTRSARRCARRPVPGRAPGGDRATLRASSASRRSPSARVRSARTARRRPSPASRRPISGCAAPRRSATRCATAGRASTARRRSPTGPGSAADGLPAMGVAVQVMVDAEVSGVMFTCNPVSGDPSVVAINASWGLGLAVVGGEVTPDDFLVSKITARSCAGRSPRRRSSTCRRRARSRTSRRCPRSCAPSPAWTTRRSRRSSRSACRVDRYFGCPPGHRVGVRARRRAARPASHGR